MIYKSQSLRPTAISSVLLLRRGISIGVPSRESNPGMPYSKQTYILLSFAAPYLSFFTPWFELRRILFELRCTL